MDPTVEDAIIVTTPAEPDHATSAATDIDETAGMAFLLSVLLVAALLVWLLT